MYFQERYKNAQLIHKKVLDITNNRGNTNQNQEISSHTFRTAIIK